ncbi:MAG: hypothetical protein ACRD1L_14140 [Terriglobales bacterium]
MATDLLQPVPASEGFEELLELESKIHRVAEALKETRAERDQARGALHPLQAAHHKLQQALAQSDRELVALRKERIEIRQRVARLMKQLEEAGA